MKEDRILEHRRQRAIDDPGPGCRVSKRREIAADGEPQRFADHRRQPLAHRFVGQQMERAGAEMRQLVLGKARRGPADAREVDRRHQ